MWGQNMCIDEMMAFLVFLYCVVVKCSSFSGKYCPIFRVTGLLRVNVEVMWRKEMYW
jgi:hypothetical protein